MKSLFELENHQAFIARHLGPNTEEQQSMLTQLGYNNMDEFIQAVVPASIRMHDALDMQESVSEEDALNELQALAKQNKVFKTYIGQGYYNTLTPAVILRNILENPAWYTAYTPYQAEISQGRLEALLNFQTMVSDLTGMDIANASLLDEGSAAAEAMTLCQRMSKSKSGLFFVDENCYPQTLDVIKTRAEAFGIELIIGKPEQALEHDCFAILIQNPGADGSISDYSALIEQAHEKQILVTIAADLLSLLLIKSPGAMGADVVIGSSQRFGVPLAFGGPHAAFMATRESFKRSLPGRLIGVSQDTRGKAAYRLALQTREQHIRREKATSNICTAQVLLAVIAGMYAVYHGPQGLKRIAERVHTLTAILAAGLQKTGVNIKNGTFFDTLTLETGDATQAIHKKANDQGINLRVIDEISLGVSLDETTTADDVKKLCCLFSDAELDIVEAEAKASSGIEDELSRQGEVLSHPIFNINHSETQMLRYMRKLADKDIALDRAMIPLGSCTMKLNATSEMMPITWPEFSQIHPFVPQEQAQGYLHMIKELEEMLCKITGYAAVSLQPNAGSQGEYAGLLAIRAWQKARGEAQRNICLIPSSAHGTNPASAQMCGMKVVVVKCDTDGNVDLDDLREKAEQHKDDLAAIMVTYPSTHGVFEEGIRELCEIVHDHGGQVYMDGANLNAMVGLCQPGKFGGDVSHLNLHKTFCIPHGGGGPGIGPVAVAEHLAPYLPGHAMLEDSDVGAVASAAWGSAGILPITWMYIKMMGADGLKQASEVAILNANYIADQLKDDFPVLYTGSNGRVAHECIIDVRPIQDESGVTVDDIAKRLIDYGFHAPTMSFPVPGTLMIEPTESESVEELDRFCAAMKQIRAEISSVAKGELPKDDNPLHNAPHTADMVSTGDWQHAYSRELAAYPLVSLRDNKYWPPVGRVDNVFGDRNLVCACPPMSEYE
ncbi:MAG: glycine dehydrogenase (aminomethyl-transferring) [SAR86 cluster bacterium]|uniref:Glycine dehydrogenase (decarboxylating) n=1 Tax=SAR86 cluster bacterium TaxID=2030880 RepID=A0A2A5CK00_9GAMM|nr:aminomethyl-transferring glycine dehydrogenase [Gammaproteobacteria bacterium AH-315-E17]PCJ43848.1 MAG: glycine dehydrogenase (aminomethyl-transferring) [SAR86 cluster bacterium]